MRLYAACQRLSVGTNAVPTLRKMVLQGSTHVSTQGKNTRFAPTPPAAVSIPLCLIREGREGNPLPRPAAP